MPVSLDRRPPEDQGVKVICAALDAGLDLLDTADVYCIARAPATAASWIRARNPSEMKEHGDSSISF